VRWPNDAAIICRKLLVERRQHTTGNPRARRIAEAPHDVVAEEVGEEDHQLGPGGNGGALLMPRLAAGHVAADADAELGEDVRDVPKPVGAYEQRVHVQSPLRRPHRRVWQANVIAGSKMIMILTDIATENAS
jgi:hypothetical protein